MSEEQRPDLPTDPDAYWSSVRLEVNTAPAGVEQSVLDQLGAPPFKKPDKGGFPFLGFLASVYDHVSVTAATLVRKP